MMPSRRLLASAVLVASLLLSSCLPLPLSFGDRSSAPPPPPSTSGSGGTTSPPDRQMPWPAHVYTGLGSPDRPVVAVPDVRPPGFIDPPAGQGIDRYFNQPLNWSECGTVQCATFAAPLDWENPDGQAITIAMTRRPATQARTSAIFINPGGPGGSAQDFVAGFETAGLEAFDIIGMDSRGSGASTPVVCGTGPQTDAYYNVDSTPDDQAERDALVAAQQAFNDQCRAGSGPLLDHISTIETIHDYDLARHLVGEQKLNFYGVSYGTFLGSVYAELYPQNVGRMVLDSAVNLTPNTEVIQAMGFDLSMRNFAKWCAEQACGLGGSEQAVVDTIVNWVNSLDAAPLPAGGSRQLTQSLAITGIVLAFYFGAEVYDSLSQVLQYTMSTGDGSYLLGMADSLNDRNDQGQYGSLTYAFPAIRCLDSADSGVQSAFDIWTGEDTQKAPIFGPLFGPDLVCPLWTARPAPQIDFSGAGAPPLLVVQNTGDSATPFRNAEIMVAELESATLVVREAPGHGAYASGSRCLDTVVVDYFVNGTVPPVGTRCTDG